MGKTKFYARLSTPGGRSTLQRFEPGSGHGCGNAAVIVLTIIYIVILVSTIAVGIKTKVDCEIKSIPLSCGGLMASLLLSIIVFYSVRVCCTDRGLRIFCYSIVTLSVIFTLILTMFFVYSNYSTVTTVRPTTNPQTTSTTNPIYSTVTAKYNTVTEKYSTVTTEYNTNTRNYSSKERMDVYKELMADGTKDSDNYCNGTLYYYVFSMVTILAALIFLFPLGCYCCCVCCCSSSHSYHQI